MTDRELLEMAAKACGVSIDPLDAIHEPDQWSAWNPLYIDGDALRLAVQLRLTVSWDRYDDCDYATATAPHTHQGYDCIVDQDPFAATRRVIVRAAAEIGKAMP